MGINHRPLLRNLLSESRIVHANDVHGLPNGEPCAAEARVHWVRDHFGGNEYLMHVSCHGEHRIVYVNARDVAVHAASAQGERLELLWMTLRDACPKTDMNEWLRSVRETISDANQLVEAIEDVIGMPRCRSDAHRSAVVSDATFPSFEVTGLPMSGTCDECGLDLAWAARHGATGHMHLGPRVLAAPPMWTVRQVADACGFGSERVALLEYADSAVAKAPGVRPQVLVDLQDEP